MADALDFRKDGKPGAARIKLLKELLAERVSDYAVDHPVTGPMRRGLDLEPDARAAYEAHSGDILLPAALVHHPSIDGFAATPDSNAAEIVEFKVPLVTTYIDWYLAGVIPDEHLPQLLAQLACAQKRQGVFVAYCPEMPPEKQLFIRRFEPSAADIAAIEDAARKFLQELEAMFDQFTRQAA